MAALGIRRCHGCKGENIETKLPAPQRSSVPDASSSKCGEQRVDKISNNTMEMSIFT